ncbi:MAG: EAL domain-containing protein [Coriobacteriia bacterium]|nr:EAL domain-containing protein [Coriobacteriia bacterium]
MDSPAVPGQLAVIVAVTIALAKSIDARVLAEGPETEEQVRFLRERGCDLGQGYYFSEPIPLDELRRLLDEGPFSLPE